jgi:hypothetical protein
MSLDLGILLSTTCLVRASFAQELLLSTLLPVAVVATIFAISKVRSKHAEQSDLRVAIERQATFVCVYILVFAYPMVSTKVVAVFTCHSIDSVSYLRADYAMECGSSAWNGLAIYASVWVAIYVIGFPVFVLRTLWSYRHHQTSIPSSDLMLGFLMQDYRSEMPALLWEGVEMVRKLLLSTISVFFPDKSIVCVATALLISTVFFSLQNVYAPYKTKAGNRLQSISLVVLNLAYFAGVLLKVGRLALLLLPSPLPLPLPLPLPSLELLSC